MRLYMLYNQGRKVDKFNVYFSSEKLYRGRDLNPQPSNSLFFHHSRTSHRLLIPFLQRRPNQNRPRQRWRDRIFCFAAKIKILFVSWQKYYFSKNGSFCGESFGTTGTSWWLWKKLVFDRIILVWLIRLIKGIETWKTSHQGLFGLMVARICAA